MASKGRRYSEEQIIRILKEVETGTSVSEVCLQRASHPNEVWMYDFLQGRSERGGKLRMLTVLDEYTRECLTIQVARSISSRQVIQQLEWLFLLRGAPAYLRSDNGPEFIAYALQQ